MAILFLFLVQLWVSPLLGAFDVTMTNDTTA
jgi:hypothetical protein